MLLVVGERNVLSRCRVEKLVLIVMAGFGIYFVKCGGIAAFAFGFEVDAVAVSNHCQSFIVADVQIVD